ncbi:MAG: hypothetical protein M3Q07_11900 [Pseudobdellovibrionaceae bacterium]|nr:hypothetical protein [Pseudobdellovibrionaceae bacterium]
MGLKRKEWSVSEARSQMSDLILQAFEAPQIIIDRKTKDEKAVAVIPLAMFEEFENFKREMRSSSLDALFKEIQESAEADGYDGETEIVPPRGTAKPVLEFDSED